jgi:hypothetical protein
MQCFSGNFEMSVLQFVVCLRVLYSHKFSNSNFEGNSPQAECFARVEKDFAKC